MKPEGLHSLSKILITLFSVCFITTLLLSHSSSPLSLPQTRHLESVNWESDNWGNKNATDLISLKMYRKIFPNGNRNAASHRWATFILDRANKMSRSKIEEYFRAFCPVSGSPLDPNRAGTAYKYDGSYALTDLSGTSKMEGIAYHCCSPCTCDTYDHIKVDTKSITTADGNETFHFLVIGNPCTTPEHRQKVLSKMTSAPDVTCDDTNKSLDCRLRHDKTFHPCVKSDHNHIIIGMLFSKTKNDQEKPNLASTFLKKNGYCHQRKINGYKSGMGEIFIKLAKMNRINKP
eukprot:GSMAST32.ASY1.ANO1.287.1 assembled CDS